MVGIGLIGFGYWGPNLARNFSENADCRLVGVADRVESRRSVVARRYPATTLYSDAADLISDSNVDAVAIATPVSSHFPIAERALLAGKHVLVEKPMAATSLECEKLIELAEKQGRVLMVDHTFVYNGAVRKIKEVLDSGDLGKVFYFDSVRVNLGLFQHDINVMWDLAPHDLSILSYLFGTTPVEVSAIAASHMSQMEDQVYLSLRYEDGLLAHLHVNWLAPVKVRQILVGGSKQMLVYDDNQPSEKVKIYNKGASVGTNSESVHQMLVQYRMGDMHAPKIDGTEALKLECEAFVDAIQKGRPALTDGKFGLSVVQVLEAAQKSMALRGAPVELGKSQFAAHGAGR